jgi:hypothetical protein
LKRFAIAAVVVLAVLAVPAVAGAKPFRASVLRLDRAHHKVRVVTPGHAVRSYRYAGKAGRKVKAGSRIAADLRGGKLRRVRAVGRTRVLRFYGRVVSDNRKGLVLRLGDGKRITLGGSKGHARAAAAGHPISISIEGLQPGQTVLVTIAFDASGGQTITIQITSSADNGGGGSAGGGDIVDDGDGGTIDDNNGEDYTVDGTVTAVDAGAGTLEIDSADGHLTFSADPSVLDGVAVGDTVEVDYAKDTSTGDLIADDVFPVDTGSGDSSGDGTGVTPGDGPGEHHGGDGSGDSSGGDGSGDSSGSGGSGDSAGGGSSEHHGGGGSGEPHGDLRGR